MSLLSFFIKFVCHYVALLMYVTQLIFELCSWCSGVDCYGVSRENIDNRCYGNFMLKVKRLVNCCTKVEYYKFVGVNKSR